MALTPTMQAQREEIARPRAFTLDGSDVGAVVLMPVMPDRWIRQMATESGMIEPFVETQKRDGRHQLRPVELWL